MKILTLVSSYRKNGNTAKIIQQVQEKMLDLADSQHVPLEFETIFLGHLNLLPCRGCRVCFDRGEQFCPLKDDLLEIKSKMKRADG